MTFHAETIIRKTRKPHRCEHCQSTIPAGSACWKEAGVWEGDFYAGYSHLDCIALWRDLFPVYGDPYDGMALDLGEVIGGDESREVVQDEYDQWRGHYPHVICRLELRWQRGDIKQRDRYMALGLEVDPEDCPEVYA